MLSCIVSRAAGPSNVRPMLYVREANERTTSLIQLKEERGEEDMRSQTESIEEASERVVWRREERRNMWIQTERRRGEF